MVHNFIKEEYLDLLLDSKSNSDSLLEIIKKDSDSFILQHNIVGISKLINFLNSPKNIFVLNGFMGAGKTKIADFLLNFVDEKVLVFKNSYQEAINLDDVLLSLFKDFTIYNNEKKVVLPKIETNIFSDKINAYVKYCNVPMLFVFDSFEINMRSKDTQKDILGFINYLSHFEKVKVIICSRSFRESNLDISNFVESYQLKALTYEETEAYLKEHSIQGSNFEIESLYKVSRGHYLLLDLSILIMKLLDISLTTYSVEYKKSTKNFLEFMISKLLSLTSDKFVKVLLILSVLRHGVSKKFLLENKFATEEALDYLQRNKVIAKKFGKYYLKDYVKQEYIKSINIETKEKLHKFLIDFYESELPLKPFERKFFLSRQTARQEIAFHSAKLKELAPYSQNNTNQNSNLLEVSYLTYSKTAGADLLEKNDSEKKYLKKLKKLTQKSDETENLETNYEQKVNVVLESKEKNFENIENAIIDKQSGHKQISPLVENMEIAKKYELSYNFSSAILYYKKALTCKKDESYTENEPIIYENLAVCYKKAQDSETAIKMFEKSFSLYQGINIEKSNEILMKIAQIYSEIYKFDKAMEYYNRILFSERISNEMAIKVYLSIAELEDNNLNVDSAIANIKKALSIAEKSNNITSLTECYFKYALLLDDIGNTNFAMKYYLRCVQTSKEPEKNKYLASAYSNLAEISCDSKNYAAAKMYYELSIEVDKVLNNYEGLYYSYSKLADLYKDDTSNKTYDLLVLALSVAKKLEDINFVVNTYVEIGDFYISREDYKRSLKSYILAKNLAPSHSAEELQTKITLKINRIKKMLGDVEYLRILNEIKRKR